MSHQIVEQRLALQGGLKAVSRIEGRGEPKIGIEEFMSVAERFGLSATALAKIRAVLVEEEWGTGPFLANYYSNLEETKNQAFERVARETFGVKHALAVSRARLPCTPPSSLWGSGLVRRSSARRSDSTPLLRQW